MRYVISRYQVVRDKNGELTDKVEPVQDMAGFNTRELAEERLKGLVAAFGAGLHPDHRGFRVREVADA